MRTTNRRRNRLRSAQYPTERWKPPLMFVVLAVGVAFGLALGLSNRLSKPPANVQEHYMLLVSDLYAQGVPLATVRDRLVSLGYSNPSVAVLAVADQLAHSSDRVSQQEADQLHNFAEALVAGPDSPALAQSPAQAAAVTTPAAPPSSTPAAAVVLPTSTVTAVPTSQPTATNETPTSSQANSQVSVPPAPPTATAAPPAPPKATAAPARAGVVRTAGHQPALLRADPTAKSAAVVVIPDGAKVQVYGTANGEAVDPGDRRWYHVVYSGHGGYLYNKLVQVGG